MRYRQLANQRTARHAGLQRSRTDQNATMAQLILSINAGSSSLKCSLYKEGEGKTLSRLANAEISAINQPPAKLKYVRGDHKHNADLDNVKDHKDAFENVLDAFLDDKEVEELKSKEDIRYACHRVVQGGNFEENQLITRETFHKIEALSDLAPLYVYAAHTTPQSSMLT